MSNILAELSEKGLISPPPWLTMNTQYMTIMGSHAYGVADTSVRDKIPDYDVYGWAIPPKEFLFPHTHGHIMAYGNKPGDLIRFGPPLKGWAEYQKHHIKDAEANGGHGKEWDLQIFNIIKFFELCRQNNPNMIDCLFTPENCVIHITEIGRMVRDRRKDFLSKECWKKFRGYAHSSLKKATEKPHVKLSRFEKEHNISHTTTLRDVETELSRRGIDKSKL